MAKKTKQETSKKEENVKKQKAEKTKIVKKVKVENKKQEKKVKPKNKSYSKQVKEELKKVIEAFNLKEYKTLTDEHYSCDKCIKRKGDLFL